MKVLHGEGNPRLLYKSPTNAISLGAVSRFGDGYILVSNPSALTNDMVDMAIFGVNNNTTNNETWARITAIDKTKGYVYHTNFTNLFPKSGSALSVKYRVYDLPYSQSSMVEEFTPQGYSFRLFNGTLYQKILGWWYSVVIDYSQKANPNTLKAFQNLFTASRNYDAIFYPRSDNPSLYYIVELDLESSTMLANKPFARGHRLFQIVLRGKNRLDQVNLTPTVFGIATDSGLLLSTEDGSIIERK